MITQEQAEEFHQLAVLLCLDIDLLKEIVMNTKLDAPKMKMQILRHWQKKEEILSDPKLRQQRARAVMQLDEVSNVLRRPTLLVEEK